MSLNAEKKLIEALKNNKDIILKTDKIKAQTEDRKAQLQKIINEQKADFDFNRVDKIERLNKEIQRAEGYKNELGYKEYEKARKIIDGAATEVVRQGVRNDNRLKDMREEIQVKIDEMKQLKADYIRLHDALRGEYISKAYELGYKEVARVSERYFMPITVMPPDISIFIELRKI